MAMQLLSWYPRLVERHLSRRERLFAEDTPTPLDRFASRMLLRSGFDFGLPHLPPHLIQRLDPSRGGTRVILFAFTRWSLEILDEAMRAAGHSPSNEELAARHIELMADLTGCSQRPEVIGDALQTLGLDQGVPLAGLPLLAGITAVEARFVAHWVESFAQGELSEERRAQLRQHAQQERLQVAGMLLAMHACEGPITKVSAKIIKRQIQDLRVARGGRTRIDAWLTTPPNHHELLGIAGGMDSSTLLRFGLVAAALDGHQSENELNYLVALASAGGVSEAELDELGAVVAQMIFGQYELVERLWTGGHRTPLDRSEVYAALRDNSERVVHELKEAGGSLNLLRRATLGQGLNNEEWSSLRSTLTDLSRTVPALAIFALPGGALLLPAAARALPFDLRPSSFRESHLAPSWFGDFADAETLFLDDPTRDFPDPLPEKP